MYPWTASIRAILKKKTLWLWKVSGTQIQKNSTVTPKVPITQFQQGCLVITSCPVPDCFDANPRAYTFSFINISAYVSKGKGFLYLNKNPKCHFTFLRNGLISFNTHQLLKFPWLSKFFFSAVYKIPRKVLYLQLAPVSFMSLCYIGSAFLSRFSLRVS